MGTALNKRRGSFLYYTGYMPGRVTKKKWTLIAGDCEQGLLWTPFILPHITRRESLKYRQGRQATQSTTFHNINMDYKNRFSKDLYTGRKISSETEDAKIFVPKYKNIQIQFVKTTLCLISYLESL